MFHVVKKSRGDCGREDTIKHVVLADIPRREDAMILAEVAALEHSEAIDVKYAKSGNFAGQHTGFTFKTNNGTYVWYEVES